MTKIVTAFLAMFTFLLAFTGTALAASAADVATDWSWLDSVRPVLDAVRGGNGWLAAALAIVLVVGLAKKFLAPRGGKWEWLNGKAGGAIANGLLAFGGMLATAITAGTAPSWALALVALKVAIGAAGGFTLIKELAVPVLRWIESKVPAFAKPWVKPLFDLLCSLFEKPGAAAIAKAEAAGKAAVEAKPARGIKGVAGKMDELP